MTVAIYTVKYLKPWIYCPGALPIISRFNIKTKLLTYSHPTHSLMKRSADIDQKRLQRINEIPREISALTKELETLLLIQQQTTVDPSRDIVLNIGDIVILTGRSLHGTQARIVGETDKHFILKLDSGRIV